MNHKEIIEKNRDYWNGHADLWFGTTALPEYGVRFPTEDDLHLFGDVRGKKMLEICCGSGHSLKYHAERGAGELYGVDLSQKQLENAAGLLHESGYSAKLICAKMEEELEVPKEYFDYVYSIYGIGWTTDLQGTFHHIASYLKKDGIFIFSWHHTLNYCVAWSCAERKFNCTVKDCSVMGDYAAGGLIGECNYSSLEGNELIEVEVYTREGYGGLMAGVFDSMQGNSTAYNYVTDAKVRTDEGKVDVIAGYGRGRDLPSKKYYPITVRSRDDKTRVVVGDEYTYYKKGQFYFWFLNTRYCKHEYYDAKRIVNADW